MSASFPIFKFETARLMLEGGGVCDRWSNVRLAVGAFLFLPHNSVYHLGRYTLIKLYVCTVLAAEALCNVRHAIARFRILPEHVKHRISRYTRIKLHVCIVLAAEAL
jgi:hypothetical protein